MNDDEIRTRIATDGCFIARDVLVPAFITRAKHELVQAIAADSGRYGPQAARDYVQLVRWMTEPDGPAPESVSEFQFHSGTLRTTTPRQRPSHDRR